jgi:hypothetical protein
MPPYWTHDDRESFIQDAIHSEKLKGSRRPFSFKVLPGLEELDEDPARECGEAGVTKALATVLYTKDPQYTKIPLKFYQMLIIRLNEHTMTRKFSNHVIILIKGSNAYKYLLGSSFTEEFHFSDMDIVININPELPEKIFKDLFAAIEIIVRQTMSHHKRFLENVMNNKEEDFLSKETVANFKKDYQAELKPGYISPFDSAEVRNQCSRNSFMLLHSVEHQGMNVKIDVPHFRYCERIPLKKTPFFCSENQTIEFLRDKQDSIGHFSLFRMKLNNLYQPETDSAENISPHEESRPQRVAADFIDISISKRDDAELVDFWKHKNIVHIFEPLIDMWITVPDIQSCIRDLEKMLYVYECPESKRDKRILRLEKLKQFHSRGK